MGFCSSVKIRTPKGFCPDDSVNGSFIGSWYVADCLLEDGRLIPRINPREEETEPLRSRGIESIDCVDPCESPASSMPRFEKSKSRAGSAISILNAGSSISKSWSGL